MKAIFSCATAMFLTLAVSIISATANAAPASPVDVVRDKYTDIKTFIGQSKDRPALEKRIRELMDSFVDYAELGKRTLPSNWASLKPKDQQRFVDQFKKMIQRSYVKKFNPDTVFTVDLNPATETAPDGSVVVKSTIHSGKSEASVNYAFHQGKGRWFAHDVVIDDISMVKNYRKQFNDIITKDGFEGLMTKLEKKNREADSK
jgi:phospholipid transport system substrate-binding protein